MFVVLRRCLWGWFVGVVGACFWVAFGFSCFAVYLLVNGVGFGVYGLFTLDCDWFDCCVEGLLVVCCTEFVV